MKENCKSNFTSPQNEKEEQSKKDTEIMRKIEREREKDIQRQKKDTDTPKRIQRSREK